MRALRALYVVVCLCAAVVPGENHVCQEYSGSSKAAWSECRVAGEEGWDAHRGEWNCDHLDAVKGIERCGGAPALFARMLGEEGGVALPKLLEMDGCPKGALLTLVRPQRHHSRASAGFTDTTPAQYRKSYAIEGCGELRVRFKECVCDTAMCTYDSKKGMGVISGAVSRLISVSLSRTFCCRLSGGHDMEKMRHKSQGEHRPCL